MDGEWTFGILATRDGPRPQFWLRHGDVGESVPMVEYIDGIRHARNLKEYWRGVEERWSEREEASRILRVSSCQPDTTGAELG
jgi:hypothetical protein